MIANCSHDERGKLSGGAAGDQTGGEWKVRGWYNRPWTAVIRFEDPDIDERIATEGEDACKNIRIGYDQSQRQTFWRELKNAGYHAKNIKTKCETDCSAGTLGIAKAVGYQTGNEKLKAIDQTGYSGNAVSILRKAGAKVYRAKKYLTSDKYIKRGDILVNEGHHVAINLTDGSEVKKAEAAEKAKAQKADVTKIARQVIDGKWGNGAARRKALTAAGYNYAEIQAEVNRILKGGK